MHARIDRARMPLCQTDPSASFGPSAAKRAERRVVIAKAVEATTCPRTAKQIERRTITLMGR